MTLCWIIFLLNVSGLAARAGRQMNKWNHNITSTLGFLFMCHLLEREVRLKSALDSHLYLTNSLFFIPEAYSHCFFFNLCISFHLFTYVLFFWLYFQSEDTKQKQFSLEFSLCEKYSYWRKYKNLLRNHYTSFLSHCAKD